MSDYLIERYNAQVAAINSKEADRLQAALTAYTTASNNALVDAASERFDAGVALYAAMAQRDHEHQHGRPEPKETEPKSEADKLIDTMNEAMNETPPQAEPEPVKNPD